MRLYKALLLFIISIAVCGTSSAQDTLKQKLQKAHTALDKVNAASKKILPPKKVRQDLKAVDKQLGPLRNKLAKPKEPVSNQTLNKYAQQLKIAQAKLAAYRKALQRSGTDLKSSHVALQQLIRDSALAVSREDSAARPVLAAQLALLNKRLALADSSVSSGLDTVTHLLTDVSTAYLQGSDLQATVNDRLHPPQPDKFKKETNYIWSAPKETKQTSIAQNLGNTYQSQDQVFLDFLDSTWGDRLLALVLGGLFFVWVFLNYRKARQPDHKKTIGTLEFRHITPIPVTGSLIVMLILSPLCQPDAPFQYMEVIHFLLLVTLTVFLWKRLKRHELHYWLFTVVMFLLIEVTTAAVHDSLFLRLWFIFLNLASIYFGFVFSRKLLAEEVAKQLIKPVLLIYLALNVLAVATNIFGRMSLAKAFTGTAIIGLTEVIGLSVFVQLMTDALELQIKLSACSGGFFSRLDVSSARLSFKKLLSGVSIIVWLLVFMINLGVSKQVWAFLNQLLDNKRSFGSLNFTIGNVLFFALILYISNLFQKHIGVLFGESSSNRFTNRVEHKSSKLTLLRLVVAIIGVLLAVMASGIPLDKLTVVLGALSVGIGLGMQNIVNNFVSGIILLFEKPFQIGDFVELADKKGKIEDIGIRASKMLTQQGGEVIIPNGDLISNRFTNWTVNTAAIQSEIVLKVGAGTDLDKVGNIISEEIGKSEAILKNEKPEVLINSIGGDSVELRILIWIKSVYDEPAFKNVLFRALLGRFSKEKIVLK
jgi:small-conductance mechanosensitive channel